MSIYSIGLSGLNAAETALKTTSNNISNVYTPGFNREITILEGNGVEPGVQVVTVQRQFNAYVAAQLNASVSNTRGLEAYRTEVDQINNLLADREAGLSPLMQNFFSSLEDLASSPSDPASRQGVMGTAGTMTAQFRAFEGYLEDMQQGVNGQIEDEVTQINNLTEQFAVLNREIAVARASRGEAPNGLLDKRDHLVRELSERMDVRLTIQDGTTYSISLPNGQQLVTGTKATKLAAIDAPNDPQRTIVAYQGASGGFVPISESLISGGALGGLMTFRSETLDKTQNQIGELAASMVIGFNDQHRLGRDLDGDQGADFFNIADPVAYSSERNSGSTEITAAEFDTAHVDQLRAADYEVRATGTGAELGFEIIRKDTGEVLEEAPAGQPVEAGEFVFADPNGDGTNATLAFGGVIVTFDDINNLAKNDRFEVQPVRHAAAGMEVLITESDEIAAGALVEVSGDMSAELVTASEGALADGWTYELSLSEDGILQFTGDTVPSQIELNGETRLVDGSGYVRNADDSGNAELVADDLVTVDGMSVRLTELPGGGEAVVTLTLEESDAGPGDNRNALALQDLQSEELVSGRATLTQAYASIVSDVGSRTNIVQVNLEASLGITEQIEALQQSESGVNLDEEAANLLRFQQFYAANARVIDTASTVFDTILGLRN
jgi:flagellar hook-associated protein 1 FlgK